jgi:hypothetical protein
MPQPPADSVYVAQVTVYARALGVDLAQKIYDTHESSVRAALNELFSSLDLEGVLIQADALHTTPAFSMVLLLRRRLRLRPGGPTCS